MEIKNWSDWQKHRTYLIICLFSFLAAANTSKFVLAASLLEMEFEKSSTAVEFLTCFNILASGIGNFFWVPVMRVIGKRPILLLALPVFVAANVWSAESHHFSQLLASSVLSGFASAAVAAPVAAVVTDLYFVHERGAKLMIFHFALAGGVFLGPLINAYIIEYSTWRVACESYAIAAGALWVTAVLFFQETTYHNRDIYAPISLYGSRTTFAGKLSLVKGYDKHRNIFHVFCDCLGIISYPTVLWTGLLVGTFSAWNIMIQLTSFQTFIKPPYDYKISFSGLFTISGFIGSILAIPVGGKLIDILSKRFTASHHCIREPEFRLYALVIPTVIGPAGVLLFGLTIADKRPWIQPAVGYAMQGFGLTAISNIVVTYLVDTYVEHAAEVLTVVFVFRGVIGAVVVLFGDNWITTAGEKQVFGEMAAVQYFLCVWAIVFVFWGKSIRALTVRYGPVRRAEYH
ncbi:polyamine transporter [Cadophora sp. MPI-SDFR-AT-0126]|nr:polyamine transporter [Leotiomycetes sp. MPI-SDFR-AT-0126]